MGGKGNVHWGKVGGKVTVGVKKGFRREAKKREHEQKKDGNVVCETSQKRQRLCEVWSAAWRA